MGEIFHSGPRVHYIWLIAKPCAYISKIQRQRTLQTGIFAGVISFSAITANTVGLGDSSWNGTLSLHVGGRQESSQTRTQAFCCESLGHHKHASWVVGCYGNLKTAGNDPHCSAWVASHHCIGWHELLETSARVLPLCLRISNNEFTKLQKTKAHLNI